MSERVERPGTDTASKAAFWARLLRYYRECVQRMSGLEELLQRSASGSRYVFPRQETEDLISGIHPELETDERIEQLARRAVEAGETLYYGYPTILVHDESGGVTRRKIGALFLVELALPPPGQPIPARLPVRSDAPFFHPRALGEFGYREEQLVALAEACPVEPHLGSHEGLHRYLEELTKQLEVPVRGAPDPSRLCQIREDEIEGVGLHNVAVIFRARGAQYNDRLIRELKALEPRWAEASGTAAAFLLGEGLRKRAPAQGPSTAGRSEERPALCAPIEINESQEAALQSAMRNPLTVVTGPPGTGKSQLVTNVVATAWLSGQTVLLGSTNNQAVDVVCERARSLWPGLVIRTGKREYRDQARELLSELLREGGALPDEEALSARLQRGRGDVLRLRELIQQRSSVEQRLAEVLLSAAPLMQSLRAEPAPRPESLSPRELRRFVRWGRRLGRAWLLRAWRVRRFLRRFGLSDAEDLDSLVRLLELERERRELSAKERHFPPMDRLWRQLVEAEARFRDASREATRGAAQRALRRGRQEVSRLVQDRWLAAWPDRSPDSFERALPYVRCWATTSLSVGATIPLKPGLFDLVIVDEASQCSIPATLPLLFRAKRALIIGDPNQLAHITTLSKAVEQTILQNCELSAEALRRARLRFREHSVYAALEARVDRPYLLDEHYRSHPQIIAFANETFYGGELTVLTDPSSLTRFGEHAVAWCDVRGRARRPESGSALNEREARAVRDEVVRLLLEEQFGGTVGVVTPFSAQARLILHFLERALPEEVREKCKLVVGTAHRFQGDERDVVVFSPVASQGIAESSLRWLLGTRNLFNVAVTRARAYLLVVGNRQYCEACEGPLGELARYVGELEGTRKVQQVAGRGQLHSEAERRLYEALLRAGCEVEPKVLVHGYECDFLVRGTDCEQFVNIECDGRTHVDHLGRLRCQDRARDRLLEALGYRVIRVPAWRCLQNPDEVAREVLRSLERVAPRREERGSADRLQGSRE